MASRMWWNMSNTKLLTKVKVLILVAVLTVQSHANQMWDHAVYLNEDYLLQWTVKEPDILFEVQVKAHGYVGFGFSRDGTIYGADIFIGWLEEGHTFYYDCHIKTHSSTGEPVVDTSQDYVLLSGSENATHTILRFRRKLNTCDEKSDVPITNDTMSVLYLYNSEKPKRGQLKKESLPDLMTMMAIHPIKSLLLLQRSSQKRPERIAISTTDIQSLDIRNDKVKLSESSPELLKSCHIHKLEQPIKSNQIIRYEPLFSSNDSRKYISFMKIYECKTQIDNVASNEDKECSERLKVDRKCLAVVAIWSRGSEGFSYPPDVGYQISESTDNLLLEVHYEFDQGNFEDSSGFRIFHTKNRRKFDAGTLSIAIRPNFLHIIAPGFKRVLSVAHCSSDCTQKALATEGINVFGVNMQTHSLGRKIKIGVVRNGEEIEPLAQESNLDSNYLENRVLDKVRKILPGDHVTVECTFNTFKRQQFTLGGESSDEEVCMATLMYYPKQEQLVSCYSQSNIANLLRALGIESLGKSGDQMVVKNPQKYAGRTLEVHLRLYDWKNEFNTFERSIKTTFFDAMCNSAFVSSRIRGFPPNITKPYRPPDSSCPPQVNPSYKLIRPDSDIDENLIEDGEKEKAIRSNPSTFSLELSSSTRNHRLSSLSLMVVFSVHLVRTILGA